MSRVVVIILLALAITFGLDFGGWVAKPMLVLSSIDSVGKPITTASDSKVIKAGTPVHLAPLTGRGLEVKLNTNGWAYAGALVIAGRGGPVFLDAGERQLVGPGNGYCKVIEGNSWRCRLPWRTSRLDAEVRLLYAEKTVTEITNVAYETASAKRLSTASRDVVICILGGLLLLAPLLRYFPAAGLTMECALIAIGGGLVAAAGPISLLAVLGLTGLGFLSVRADAATRPSAAPPPRARDARARQATASRRRSRRCSRRRPW